MPQSEHDKAKRSRSGKGRGARVAQHGESRTDSTRKRAESPADDSLLALFVENAPVAAAMFDREMRYLLVSRRWIADGHLEGREIIGRSHYEVFPDIPERWKEIHRRCLDGEEAEAAEDRFDRADGSVTWERWSIRPWRDSAGEVGGLVIFSEDITARKRAEEALRASEELNRRIIENFPGGIVRVAADGSIVASNAEAQRLLGLSFGELASREVDDFAHQTLHEDGTPCPIEDLPVSKCLRTGWPQPPQTIGTRRPDGEIAWALYTAVPLFDSSSFQLTGALVTFLDITERRRAQELIRQSRDDLERHVAERTDRLERANESLRREIGERLDAEAALARSEARYRTLVENAPDLILTVDREGKLLFINRGFPPYETDRIVGTSMFQYVDPATHEEIRDRLAAVFASGETQSYETRAPGPDGGLSWYNCRIGAIEHGDEVVAATIIATDVTEIRQAAETLRERQRFIQQITDTAPFLLYVYDVDQQRNVYVNSQIEDLLGYAPEQVRAMGAEITDLLVHPDDRERSEEALQREMAAKDGEVVEVEYRMRHASGVWRWFHTRNVVFQRDPDGGPRQILGTAHDITARREAEEALRQSEAKLSALLENTTDSIWSVDRQHRLALYNSCFHDRFQEIFGDEPYIGMEPTESVPPELAEQWIGLYDRALAGERISVQQEFDVAGRPQAFDISINPIRHEGTVSGVAVFGRDITEHRRQEAEIRSQSAILESTFDSISDGVVVADEQGRFVVFNRAARNILGIGPLDESRERWSAAYGLFLPDTTTPYPADQLPLVRAGRGENVDDAQIFMRHAGRTEGVWLSVSARPMFDAAGACRGGVAAFRDITESKRAQELILAEQQVKEQMLIAHDRDRRLMAYEIHDGLVQTITAAKMHLEALRAQVAKAHAGEGAGFDLVLDLLRDAIDDGRRLITGLRPPSIDELGVIAALDDLVREQAAYGGPRIEFIHDVQFDRLQSIWETVLYRIVQEALVNVRRHSRAREVAVRIEQVDDVVHLVVEDDGVGFDPSKVSLGRYGLRGIRERARLLQGRAEIDSAPGRGTTIRVELPIATAQTPAERTE